MASVELRTHCPNTDVNSERIASPTVRHVACTRGKDAYIGALATAATTLVAPSVGLRNLGRPVRCHWAARTGRANPGAAFGPCLFAPSLRPKLLLARLGGRIGGQPVSPGPTC